MNSQVNGPIHITVMHEFYTPQHLKALYECGTDYDLIMDDYIVISTRKIIKEMIENIRNRRGIVPAIKTAISRFLRRFKIYFLKSKVVIVGIAPYSSLMNKYKKIFANNVSFYFTSCEIWDGSECSTGKLSNRAAFEKILRENFRGIACVSQKTSDEIGFMGLPRAVVNHSINVASYHKKQAFNCKQREFIFFGQYIERKGIDFILRWFDENQEENIGITFYGAGPLKEDILRFAKRDPRVKEKGFLSQNELREHLNEFYFSLLPTRREPFGMSIIEAMASGLPTLASDVIGPSEIIKDSEDGFLFQCNDYLAFCEKMDQILGLSEDAYREICNRAMQSAWKYDASEIVKRWNILIRENIR